jgi:hypothetical protein
LYGGRKVRENSLAGSDDGPCPAVYDFEAGRKLTGEERRKISDMTIQEDSISR